MFAFRFETETTEEPTMTKRTRTQQDQSQAQRDERMSDLLQQLEAGVEAIQTSEDFQRYLKTCVDACVSTPPITELSLSRSRYERGTLGTRPRSVGHPWLPSMRVLDNRPCCDDRKASVARCTQAAFVVHGGPPRLLLRR